VLVVERNFTEFSGEVAHDQFGKCHESSLWVGRHGEAALEGTSAVCSAVPGGEDKGVAAVGLMRTEAVEFAMRSSARSPTWRAS
jgi:hypothetical protein